MTKIQKIGTDYGGHYIPSGLLTKDSVIYSGGAGEDISFDVELAKLYGCSIHIFDPTPRAISYCVKTVNESGFSNLIKIYDFGLSHEDGDYQFWGPNNPANVSHSLIYGLKVQEGFTATCRKLSTVMVGLNHEHIDLLKLDVEGAEYGIISDIYKNKLNIKSITLEFHVGSGVGGLSNAITDAKRSLSDIGFNLLYEKDRHALFLNKTI